MDHRGVQGLRKQPPTTTRNDGCTAGNERMGDQRKHQSDWRKQTINYWKRPNAKSWITDCAEGTVGKCDVGKERPSHS